MKELVGCRGVQWDEGNAEKNRIKHGVSRLECEEPFFNEPFIVTKDEKHSQEENRYYALGQTHAGRLLFIVFTIREDMIRVISARDMSRKERRIYEKAKKEN
ncbi:MAG: BrnT family toxin [Acidobacteria bacterium]|nr:MAG: BrnT family toxin [Acidobacteriota bacterium]